MPHNNTAQHKQPIIIHCTIKGNISSSQLLSMLSTVN